MLFQTGKPSMPKPQVFAKTPPASSAPAYQATPWQEFLTEFRKQFSNSNLQHIRKTPNGFELAVGTQKYSFLQAGKDYLLQKSDSNPRSAEPMISLKISDSKQPAMSYLIQPNPKVSASHIFEEKKIYANPVKIAKQLFKKLTETLKDKLDP